MEFQKKTLKPLTFRPLESFNAFYVAGKVKEKEDQTNKELKWQAQTTEK
jgi:hypothetical protein